MLISITFLILVSSLNIDDIIGQAYAIYIIVVAGAESAIGLGILVAFYRFYLLLSLILFIDGETAQAKICYASPNYYGATSQITLFSELEINFLQRGHRPYSTVAIPPLQSPLGLNPWFITGFTDAVPRRGRGSSSGEQDVLF